MLTGSGTSRPLAGGWSPASEVELVTADCDPEGNLRDGPKPHCHLDGGAGAPDSGGVVSFRRWLVAVATVGLVLGGCGFIVLKMFVEHRGELAYIGATGETPVRYAFSDELEAQPDDVLDSEKISGVTPVEMSDACYDLAFYLLILDGQTGRELHRRELREQPLCQDDRLLWNGKDLLRLDDGLVFGLFGEPWPERMYVAPFSVASTADDPIVVEHGWPQQFGMRVVERGTVTGVVSFTPATDCAPRARSYGIRVRDATSQEILARSGSSGHGFCDGRRWLWDGDALHVLDHDEAWPTDLSETTE